MRAKTLVVGVDGIGDAGAINVLAPASGLGVASLAPDPDAISLPLLSILLLIEILGRVVNYLSNLCPYHLMIYWHYQSYQYYRYPPCMWKGER